MHPELGVGPLAVPAYAALLMLGFVAAAWLLRRRGEARGLDGPALIDVGLIALALGIVGARAMAVLTDGQLGGFVRRCLGPPYDCLAALEFWHGGLSFHGGLLLAIPGALWLARRRGLPRRLVADLAAAPVMLGLAIGKLGCFLEGCCYGVRTGGALGVVFPGHAAPRHPTQLYEAAGALVLAIALDRLAVRRPVPGRVFAAMLLGHGGFRLAIEVLRGDPRGAVGPLSVPQVVAIGLAVTGAVLALSWRHAPAAPPGPAPGPGLRRQGSQPDR